MDIAILQRALGRAAGVLKAAGATAQAKSVEAVNTVLADSGDESVEGFVDNTVAALSKPRLRDLPSPEVASMLRAADVDTQRFEALYSELASRDVDKKKACEVASYYTGARPTAWKSKPQALKAIRQKFDDRVFLDSKSKLNDRVTPW